MAGMRKALLVVCCALALAGCSKKFEKAGATKDDMEADLVACEKQARNVGYFGGGLTGEKYIREFRDRCMKNRGWEEK
jgi:hypothetical protein